MRFVFSLTYQKGNHFSTIYLYNFINKRIPYHIERYLLPINLVGPFFNLGLYFVYFSFPDIGD